MLYVARDSECGDADLDAVDTPECQPASFGGGSGGDDVVDQEYVFPLQLLWIT